MTKRKRILLTIAASLAGLIVVLVIASILVLRSAWFANYVREKIIAVTEESTGGKVEIAAFQFDWVHLTARIRNFVLHGTEPPGSDPLVRVQLLEVRLKLLAGLKKAVDIQYLGIQQPQVNFIVFPDGKTNVPQPKIQKKPSQTSGLETVVDLAVGQFQIQNGLLEFSQQETAFSAQGENLRALLNYNFTPASYQGNLSIHPLFLSSGNRPPLNVHVNLPVTLEKDAVRLANAKLNTDQSQIVLSAAIEQMNAPVVSAHLNANVSLPEVQRSFELPVDANAKGAPRALSADLALVTNPNKNMQLQTAHIALGQTTFEASGTLRDASKTGNVQFNANFALTELAALLKVTSAQATGALQAHGTAKLDAQNNYFVDGTLNTRDVSLRSGTTRLSNVSLYSPFHADPYLVSLDGLKLNAAGGNLSAKIFIENMQKLSVEGHLQGFAIPVLAQTFTGKRLGYDGTIDGSLRADGDLKAKGTTGYSAQARLLIVPGYHGVPLSGHLNADYVGARDTVTLDHSYLALPSSRIDLSGSPNQRVDVNLTSRNLNDFLPAANFGSSGKPQTSLPITLEGGAATVQAQITGDLSAPHISAHMAMNNFAVSPPVPPNQPPGQPHLFNRFALDLAASPSGASIQNGILTRNTLQTNFDASIGLRKWSPVSRSPLTANLTMRNGDLADLLTLAGESSIPATGNVGADVHVGGTYGNPLGSATLQVLNGSAYQEAFDRLYAKINLSDQLITLSTLELASGSARIDVNGTFQHPRDSFTVGHAQLHLATSNLQLANLKTLQRQSPGVGGLIQLSADAAADLRQVNHQSEVNVDSVTADLSARGLRVQHQDAGDLTATARTVGRDVNYQLASNFAGSSISVKGQTALTKDYATTADAFIQNLSVEKTLQITGQTSIPARGTLSANAHVAGTLQAPNADLTLALVNANVYTEPLNRFQATLHYSNTLVDIPSLELDAPAGRITLTGSFSHPEKNFNAGSLKLRVSSSDIQVAKIQHVRQEKPAVTGIIRLAADLSANLREQNGKPAVLFSNLNADASANSLRMNDRNLGEARFTAHTAGSTLNFSLDSDIAASRIHGSGQGQLSGDYPLRANLSFANIKYSNIAPFISSEPSVKPSFDALVEGEASVNGPVLKNNDLTGRLQLSRLEMTTVPQESPTGAPPPRALALHNEGPVVIALNHSVVQIQHLDIEGPSSAMHASGQVNLSDTTAPLGLNLDANLDLKMLQDINRDVYSNGNVTLQAAVHGDFAQPLVNGRIELKNANLNYASAPNGLSNGNGVILLNGTSASIQNLTGESGGGKIVLAGFIGFTGTALNYNVQASATRVRTRYSGISVVSSATLRLTGNSERSLMAGGVTIQRIAYQSSGDIGSMLTSASTPPSTPETPSGIIAGMRLDIHILTAPDLRVITTYAQRLQVEADLTVRGTAANPGVIGRVSVTNGQLVFFGNEYTVNTGTVNFYNPTAIQPVLDVSLEANVQGVDVTIGVSGPMDNLKLTYRSDPPLTFEQIVELLAANKTPTTDPTIAAQQPTPPQQSFTQMGESAILGQAVANPLASRVQRVFGLSQFKIDPSFAGSGGQPSARVTLQQQITQNLTFTYITDVTQTNSEIIRVEWAFTPQFSGVALHDYNGNVSIQFFYKFKVR
ncbi:MAG: translocation/assembly module TamB domain-containing protein [Acidobacteriaceae bacterium]|nr:translocation/assembly module TamB domain-containing protein [Acidobacteriaceae bacterium]MBV9780768.1 translocation/assembly module TamB domain-containing protein [Acidobacteriaceae bacterium]